MTVEKIYKEWNLWMRARKLGYKGDIVWSDEKDYIIYLKNVTNSLPTN